MLGFEFIWADRKLNARKIIILPGNVNWLSDSSQCHNQYKSTPRVVTKSFPTNENQQKGLEQEKFEEAQKISSYSSGAKEDTAN